MAKTVVITGANSGIGFETAKYFAAKGDKVIMACRSVKKAQKAEQDIKALHPNGNILLLQLDVSSMASIKAFHSDFSEQVGQLDILVNNAGIVAIPLQRNAEGLEMQTATNYLGAFALTGLLLPYFNNDSSTPSRIVNVGSLAHRFGKLEVNNLNWNVHDYNEWKAYANSKIAIMSHTLELNRRLKAAGKKIIALAAHPGFANTNIHQASPKLQKKGALQKWIQEQGKKITPTAAEAARPIILAADSPTVEGGEYYGPGGWLEIGGKPGKAKINKIAFDKAKAADLWAASEKLCGVKYLNIA